MATIQGVYVALFGRPADPAGLAYFNSITKNGADLAPIANLSGQPEYTTRFAGQSNTQVVNSIYQSLFGRDAEATGLNFFVDALNKGTLNINKIAIAILDGAQGTDKTIVTTKVAAADLYTKSIDTAAEIGSYSGTTAGAQGRAFISGVSTTVPTQTAVDNAIIAMQNAGAAGNTITATAAFTTLNSTTGIGAVGDIKVTTNNNDTINAGINYAPTTSKIDAGLGLDTLNATFNGIVGANGIVATDGLKNVEVVNATGLTVASVLDVTNAKELTTFTHVATPAVGDNAGLTVSGLASTVTYGEKGALGAVSDVISYTGADSSTTAKIAFDTAVTTGSLTVNTVGTLNISTTGTTSVPLAANAAKAIVLSGDGNFTLAANDAVLESVTASSFTGSLTTDLSANAALKTVVGGTGLDSVKLDVSHTNDITISTGAGADTITILSDRTTTAVVGDGVAQNSGNKAIVLTGGDGADTFVFGNANANPVAGTAAANSHDGATGNVNTITTVADLVKSLITVSDFAKASDGIKISDGATPATAATLVTLQGGDYATISAQTDLLAAATKAATFIGVDKVGIFDYGSDAYILVNSGTTAFEAGDTLVKVTGAVHTDFTAANVSVI